MRMIPEFTPEDKRKLDRALDRVEAGISIYRTQGRPVKPKAKKWDMDGMVGPWIVPHAIQPHTHYFTIP